MKATYFMGHETFEVRECPIPKAKPGTVVVKNYACGVCGTDVHIYHGEKGSAAVNPPVVLGHEYSGVVTEVGEGVKGLKIGDHVTIDPNIYCGECEYCRNGKKQMCRHMEAVGVTMNGGFEEYSIVPAAQALLLDPNVPLEYGAMSEPLACCLHGIDRAEIKVGDIVCVVGDGADVIIECAGNHAAVESAFKFARRGATILLFSVPKVEATYEVPLFDVYQKELTIKGTFVNPDTHLRAVELINSGRIQIAPIITHTFTLDELPEAIAMQMSAEAIKVIVKA